MKNYNTMKKIIAILALMVMTISMYGQQPLKYTKEIKVENKTKEELLKAAQPFIVSAFDSNEKTVDCADSIVVEGKAYIEFNPSGLYSSILGKIRYTARLVFKNGMVMFSETNYTHEPDKKVMFDNNMGILVDPLPKDLSEIGIKGATRKSCYKYYHKLGTILCKQKYDEQTEKFVGFLYK